MQESCVGAPVCSEVPEGRMAPAESASASQMALAGILERNRVRIFARVYRIVRRADVANECIQQAYLRCMPHALVVDAAYLAKTARNLALDHVLRSKEEWSPESGSSRNKVDILAVAEDSTTKTLARQVWDSADGTEQKYIQAYLEHGSYSEAALALACDESSIRGAFKRLRQRLGVVKVGVARDVWPMMVQEGLGRTAYRAASLDSLWTIQWQGRTPTTGTYRYAVGRTQRYYPQRSLPA